MRYVHLPRRKPPNRRSCFGVDIYGSPLSSGDLHHRRYAHPDDGQADDIALQLSRGRT